MHTHIAGLFVGPGRDFSNEPINYSEILEFPGFEVSTSPCVPPPLPNPLVAYFIMEVNSQPLLCGGFDYGINSFSSSCFLLSSNGWQGAPQISSLLKARAYGPSVMLESGWWITGGYDGDYLASTELRGPDGTWTQYDNLPRGMAGHCMVAVNRSHVFMTGGEDGVSILQATYIYDIQNKIWHRMKDMSTGRSQLTCIQLDDDTILVAGGQGINGALRSTELYSLSSGNWIFGQDLPGPTFGSQMIKLGGNVYHVGDLQTGDQESSITRLHLNPERWEAIGSLGRNRIEFGATVIRLTSDCNG